MTEVPLILGKVVVWVMCLNTANRTGSRMELEPVVKVEPLDGGAVEQRGRQRPFFLLLCVSQLFCEPSIPLFQPFLFLSSSPGVLGVFSLLKCRRRSRGAGRRKERGQADFSSGRHCRQNKKATIGKPYFVPSEDITIFVSSQRHPIFLHLGKLVSK